MGGAAWDNKVTLKLDYTYSGQGLTGTTSSLEDLKRGAFVELATISRPRPARAAGMAKRHGRRSPPAQLQISQAAM